MRALATLIGVCLLTTFLAAAGCRTGGDAPDTADPQQLRAFAERVDSTFAELDAALSALDDPQLDELDPSQRAIRYQDLQKDVQAVQERFGSAAVPQGLEGAAQSLSVVLTRAADMLGQLAVHALTGNEANRTRAEELLAEASQLAEDGVAALTAVLSAAGVRHDDLDFRVSALAPAPTPTPTLRPTTPTPSPTAGATPSPTPSPTPTETPPSPTATPGATPMPTATPTAAPATRTPTPSPTPASVQATPVIVEGQDARGRDALVAHWKVPLDRDALVSVDYPFARGDALEVMLALDWPGDARPLTRFWLEAPDGQRLAEATGVTTLWQAEVTAPAAGTYRFWLDNRGSGSRTTAHILAVFHQTAP